MDFNQFINSKSVQGQRKVSDKQWGLYTDLCARKGQEVDENTAFTARTLGEKIDKLMEMNDIASPAQVERINIIIQEINALGGAVNHETRKQELISIPEEQIDSLSGGREGTASRLIEWLYERKRELSVIAPPSENQLEKLVDWFLCPAIPFEAFDIKKKVDVEIEGRDNAWRFMTREEFKQEISNKMKQQEASRFITKYSADFYEWKKTRITDNQMKHIRDLEERLNVIEPVSDGVEFTFKDGALIEEHKGKRNSRTRREERGGYNCLTEDQLRQFSYHEASEWIQRLNYEIKNIRSTRTMHNEEAVNDEREYTRTATSQYDAENKEFQSLNDLIYACESILGYEDTEAHDKVKHILVSGSSNEDAQKEERAYLNNFFMSTVTANQKTEEEEWKRQMARIYNMCSESDVALEILTEK